MKKQLFIFLIIVCFPVMLISQETEDKTSVTFSGFVRYELFFDTYESVDTRDGEVYLYPLSEYADLNGNDINNNYTLNMLGLQARPRISATGPNAFGAKVTGVLEGDFLGVSQADSRMLRLRHGFLNLKWENSALLMGHTWHPMFVTECFPATVSMGAGVPFHVLNRAPQVRYTAYLGKSMSVMGALLIHGYHKSVGPAEAQRNSSLPDAQVQFKFKNDVVFSSFTAGYKWLTPRLETTDDVKTNETIGSFNVAANTKLSFDPITIKFEGIYGQNLTHFVMIGGYGATEAPTGPTRIDDYEYTNINTMSVWTDVALNLDFMEVALFGGYSSNLGAKGDYYALAGYTRGGDIKSIFRVSPRVIVKSGKVDFGLEYMITGAVYGTLDIANNDYFFTDTNKPTINNRMIFTARYKF
ncbi:MAG: hypothetical protein PF485_05340 [Bacteroidales bacterium]|jgi:hypothetical protein|nr:hypothetical protein [Bacteroidales bacterium]